MAVVNGGILHYTDIKKFLKNLLLRNCWFKTCSQNFDPSINMALVNGGFLHHIDMKKFLKNPLLRNRWSDFEIISQECSLGDPFQNCSQNFDLSINMALVNGGFLHYTDMKKFIKSLFLGNRWSDCEKNSQECSFGDPFEILLAKFWSIQKHGTGEWGLFALYRHEEILKKSSSYKNRWSDLK